MRIYQTSRLKRLLGLFCLIFGLGIMCLLAISVAQGTIQLTSRNTWIGLVLGSIFAYIGFGVGFDDYVTIDKRSKQIIFYERLLRAKEIARYTFAQARTITIDQRLNPSSKGPEFYYCVMIHDHDVKVELTREQADRFRSKLLDLVCQD